MGKVLHEFNIGCDLCDLGVIDRTKVNLPSYADGFYVKNVRASSVSVDRVDVS